jgi:uncharacterized membrane protein
MVSQALAERSDTPKAGPLTRTLAAAKTRHLLIPLAASELLGDKLPFAPDRTIAPSMMVRALSGGLTAAALAGARRQPAWVPALIGATAACVSAKIAIRLRKRYGRSGAAVNAALGIAEDSLALAIGNAGLKRALNKN